MSIKNTVSNMLGMKFGSYKASVNNMNKVYQNVMDESLEGVREIKLFDTISSGSSIISSSSSTIRKRTDGRYEENGKYVALASYDKEAGKVNYSVWDAKMQRTYSSGWNNTGSDKFNCIAFDGYAVEDANKNGILDENDLICIYDEDFQIQTIKDFLN